MAGFQKIAALSEIPLGGAKCVEIGEEQIALFNVDGKICAVDNNCPHQGGPLSEGSLNGKEITCPWHNWRFNVETGVSPVNPSVQIKCYKSKVEGDSILVEF